MTTQRNTRRWQRNLPDCLSADSGMHARPAIPLRRRPNWGLGVTVAISAALLIGGCRSRPRAVKPVEIDAGAASREAIETYDRNDDNQLDDSELANVAGIAKYKARYDGDGDGKVTQDEIATRLSLWKKQGLGYRELSVVVTMDGRPLSGATVRLTPEAYLGDNVKSASGQTDANGVATVAIARADLPRRMANMNRGLVMGGTYKIEITHPKKKIPPKYNTATTLGEEIALDTVKAAVNVRLDSQ